MPALARLRELAAATGESDAAGATDDGEHVLVFWTSRGVQRLACRVSLSPRAPGPPLVVVRAAPLRDTSATPLRDDVATPLRDDTATLREIARHIRDGLDLRRATRTRAPDAAVPAASASAPAAGTADDANAPLSPDALARLAHELKSPISAIIAAAEIMRDERLGPIANDRYRSYASDIHDSARHALGVIGRMMGAPGAAADVPVLDFVELDLNAIAAAAASAMRPLAEGAGLSLAIDLAPRLPRVVADALSLRQILLNLVTNAVKFTPPGGEVRIATHHVLDGPVSIEVGDTGPGMSAAAIAASLDPAARPRSSPGLGGGLGIGLPLVRRLAHANGGTVSIDSAPGQGTSVVVSFAKDRVIPV